MSDSTLTANVGLAAPRASRPSAIRTAPDSRMRHSRIIGILFLAGFVVYGTGFGLVSSVIAAPDFLTSMATRQHTLVLGALLMLLTIVTDVWRAVVFFPILGERGRSTALTYLAAQIISVMLFFFGVLSLLLLVPLSHYAGGANGAWATALGSLLVQSNQNAYQIAQIALAFGSLSLWTFGLRVRLISRALATWALVGYVFLLAGSIAELFGVQIGTLLLIPGALFEIVLPFWLFFKGFNAEAYGLSAA